MCANRWSSVQRFSAELTARDNRRKATKEDDAASCSYRIGGVVRWSLGPFPFPVEMKGWKMKDEGMHERSPFAKQRCDVHISPTMLWLWLGTYCRINSLVRAALDREISTTLVVFIYIEGVLHLQSNDKWNSCGNLHLNFGRREQLEHVT